MHLDVALAQHGVRGVVVDRPDLGPARCGALGHARVQFIRGQMCPSGSIGKSHSGHFGPARADRDHAVGEHRPDLRARRVQPRDVPFALFRRGRRLVVVGGLFAELEEDEGPLGVEADADQPGAEERLVLLHRAARGQLAERAGLLGVLLGDAVEELLGLGGEQGHLLLLDQHREHRLALPRLDHERALAGLPERARADRVDGIELDRVGHDSTSASVDGAAGSVSEAFGSVSEASGSGTRSARPPVSLHFTSSAPYAWKSNTVTDAGLTCSRWNRSRCMPV